MKHIAKIIFLVFNVTTPVEISVVDEWVLLDAILIRTLNISNNFLCIFSVTLLRILYEARNDTNNKGDIGSTVR